jgi:imidazolonepropionase-like amidohydrolase
VRHRAGATLAAAAALALGALACGGERHVLVRLPAERPALLLRDVAVLDVASGERTPGQDVLVEDGRIAAIAQTGALPLPDGALVLEGAGDTLLPGLVDAHAHVMSDPAPPWRSGLPDPEHVLQSYLYCGVTTVLDAADSSGDAFSRRARVAAGELAGPRIFTAGMPLTAPEGHPVGLVRQLAPWWIAWYLAPRIAVQVSSAEQARAAADELAGGGADFVKLIVDRIPADSPRLGAAELRAAVEGAHAHGVRAIAHIGSLEDARDAARAGADAWVHGVYRERLSDEAVAELAGFGIPMVPTLTVFDSYAGFDDPREPTALERQIATAELLASFDAVPEGDPAVESFAPFLALLRAERQSGPDNARRLHAAGVTLFAGSDPQSGVFPGAGLHRELAHLVAAGLTPIEAIRAATLLPARFLTRSEREPEFGEVAVGRRADLLLVEGDPSADVAALARIREVILGGVRVERFPVTSAR